MNEDGDLIGPRETSEVFLTLDEAKTDADSCFEQEWGINSSPAP
jgi:hypothetical protein